MGQSKHHRFEIGASFQFPDFHSLFPLRKPGHLAISLATAVVLLFKASSTTDAFTIVTSFHVGLLVSLGACLFMLILAPSSFDVFTRTWYFGEAYSSEDVWSLIFRPKLIFIPEILLIIASLSC
jgi:hypothetical protein